MSKNIVSIQINKIIPLTELKIEKTYINRIKSYDEELLLYDILLPVEKIGEDMYLLVGGYDKYTYLKLSGYKSVPCIIEDTSLSESIMEKKILRRLFAKGDSLKENKQIFSNKLSKTNFFYSILISFSLQYV